MPSRTRERLIALFVLGILLFAPPLLLIFNTATRVLGVPLLYLYLFVVWAILIVLVAIVVERSADPLAEADPDPAGKEARGSIGGRSDA